MNEIRRKLRGQDGVTLVFALAVFLILTLFSSVMVNASMNSVHGAYAGRLNEQAALSVASASRVMQGVIRDRLSESGIRYTTASGIWETDDAFPASDEILNGILNALNGAPSPALTLETVSSDPEQKIAEAIGAVEVDITAEYENGVTSPRLILNFRQTVPVPYYSCAIITLYCEADDMSNPASYVVASWNTRSMLGKYETPEDTP